MRIMRSGPQRLLICGMRSAGNGALSLSAVRPITVWLLLVLCFDVAVQIIRLQHTDPAAWLLWDYISRVGALLLLAINPDMRAAAFRRERLQVSSRSSSTGGFCSFQFPGPP